MYINTQYLFSKGLLLEDVVNLQLIKQNTTEDLKTVLEKELSTEDIERYESLGLLSYVKAKNKSQTVFDLVRLSKEGKEILENIETPEITEETITIFNWVKEIYLRSNKDLGNQKKCKMYIEQFSKESGIVKNSLCYLINSFLTDEKEFEFSQRLEYLFYRGSSVFNVKFDINQSRLYQYFLKREKFFSEKFADIDNNS